MKQLCGNFDLQTGELCQNSLGVFCYDDAALLIQVWGRVKTGEAVNDGKAIAAAYKEFGTGLTAHIGGVYLLMIYDKMNRTLAVFHDRVTSPVALYYTVYEGKLYFSNSLKTVLWESGMPRALDETALEDFIVNGYIYGRDTLVKEVKKLEAFHALTAKIGGAQQVPVSYTVKEMTKGEALDAWKPVLDKAVEECFAGESEINAPLSSGYDSSYIVDVASKKGSVPINAFSVGGKFGKNELPLVKENVKQYDKITLNTALTSDDTLQNLPDIVWRLEGNVYESGLFLQYELANLVKKNGKPFMICGECADQVMNENYMREDRIHPEKKDGKPLYYEFAEYPYIFGHYLILKKNGIMFNSFDIETRYPYIDDAFVPVAHALGLVSGKDKRVHVANCRECLPPEVIKNISKIGGATECHSLFNSKAEMKQFIRYVENSPFYQAHREMIERHSFDAGEDKGGLKTKIRNAVLNLLRIGKEGRQKSTYWHEEMKLRQYLSYLYVIVFEKLIVSGEYNAQFGNDGIALKLKDFM